MFATGSLADIKKHAMEEVLAVAMTTDVSDFQEAAASVLAASLASAVTAEERIKHAEQARAVAATMTAMAAAMIAEADKTWAAAMATIDSSTLTSSHTTSGDDNKHVGSSGSNKTQKHQKSTHSTKDGNSGSKRSKSDEKSEGKMAVKTAAAPVSATSTKTTSTPATFASPLKRTKSVDARAAVQRGANALKSLCDDAFDDNEIYAVPPSPHPEMTFVAEERPNTSGVMRGIVVTAQGSQVIVRVLLDTATLHWTRSLRFHAVLVNSLIPLSRMYVACCSPFDFPFAQALLGTTVPAGAEEPVVHHDDPDGTPRASVASHEVTQLNGPQQLAVDRFLQLSSGLQLLQGPPGTGKTSTIVHLLSKLCHLNQKVLVATPSNQATQLLAFRFSRAYPAFKAVLVGVEDKLVVESRDFTDSKDQETILRGIFIHTWAETRMAQISKLLQCREVTAAGIARLRLDMLPSFLESQGFDAKAFAKQTDDTEIRAGLKTLLHIFQPVVQQKRGSFAESQYAMELELAANAQVIFATLSVCGREIMNTCRPDVLVVDEAGQAVEAETLIPFQYNPRKVLMVGDPQQLPATTISQKAAGAGFARSTMQRLMEECNYPFTLLKIQYRMNPAISAFPNRSFYHGKLENAPIVCGKERKLAFPDPLLGPYSFIDVRGTETKHKGTESLTNKQEAAVCADLVNLLQRHFPECSIGVVSFYAAQVGLISSMVARSPLIKIHTVDSFQGSELDIIILSFVRSRKEVGFLRDARRLNVALTRARFSLLMVGHFEALQQSNCIVSSLMKDLTDRKAVFALSRLQQLIKH